MQRMTERYDLKSGVLMPRELHDLSSRTIGHQSVDKEQTVSFLMR